MKDLRLIKPACSSLGVFTLTPGDGCLQLGLHLVVPTPSSPTRTPCNPTWSPKKAECRRLRSPKSPMELRLLDSAGPALGRKDGGGRQGVLRLRTEGWGGRECHS